MVKEQQGTPLGVLLLAVILGVVWYLAEVARGRAVGPINALRNLRRINQAKKINTSSPGPSRPLSDTPGPVGQPVSDTSDSRSDTSDTDTAPPADTSGGGDVETYGPGLLVSREDTNREPMGFGVPVDDPDDEDQARRARRAWVAEQIAGGRKVAEFMVDGARLWQCAPRTIERDADRLRRPRARK